MKFLADINIPNSVIQFLDNQNYDVLDLKKINILASDKEIVRLAQEQKRIILTLDKDFISLLQFPKYHVGCIVIRLFKQDPNIIIPYIEQLLKYQQSEVLESSLTIITPDSAKSHQNN